MSSLDTLSKDHVCTDPPNLSFVIDPGVIDTSTPTSASTSTSTSTSTSPSPSPSPSASASPSTLPHWGNRSSHDAYDTCLRIVHTNTMGDGIIATSCIPYHECMVHRQEEEEEQDEEHQQQQEQEQGQEDQQEYENDHDDDDDDDDDKKQETCTCTILGVYSGPMYPINMHTPSTPHELSYRLHIGDVMVDARHHWSGRINHTIPSHANVDVDSTTGVIRVRRPIHVGDAIYLDYGPIYWLYQITRLQISQISSGQYTTWCQHIHQQVDDYTILLSLHDEIIAQPVAQRIPYVVQLVQEQQEKEHVT